jgi:hypothetical protein
MQCSLVVRLAEPDSFPTTCPPSIAIISYVRLSPFGKRVKLRTSSDGLVSISGRHIAEACSQAPAPSAILRQFRRASTPYAIAIPVHSLVSFPLSHRTVSLLGLQSDTCQSVPGFARSLLSSNTHTPHLQAGEKVFKTYSGC